MRSIDSDEIILAITKIAQQIATTHKEAKNIVLAGVANGGIPFNDVLFETLKPLINCNLSKGVVDISFYRDDVAQKPFLKEVEPTQLSHNPEDTIIIIVDDVLFSGRSVRAAMAELHAIGRPEKIELAILVDRGNRRLPIAPDYVGFSIETTLDENVNVSINPSSLTESKIEII